MDAKPSGKIINMVKVIKLIFLVAIVAGGAMLLERNYKKSEKFLMRELKSAEARSVELQLRLNRALETIVPVEESIEPLKEEIDNLRRIILLEKSISNAQEPENKDRILWQENGNPVQAQGAGGGALSVENILPRPLPASPAEGRLIGPEAAAPYKEKNLSRLKDYIKDIEQQNAAIKERSDQLDKLLDEKEGELARLNEHNLALKEELAVKEKERAELSRESMQLKEFKNEAEKEMARLNSRSAEKEEEIARLNKRLSELDSSQLSLQGKIEELGNLIKIKESEISGSRDEIASLKGRISEVLREKEALFFELKDKEKVIVELRAGLVSAESLQQNNIKQFIEFQQNNIALRQKIMDFAKELELLKLEKNFGN